MLRLLSRGRKQAEGDEEPKQYKKANLGLSNKMYYNEELKMWVERGKEEEARVEKAKLNAPPPSVGSMSAASSSTSLATMSDAASAAGGPAPALNFSRAKGLSGRYVNVSTIPTAPAGGAGPTPGGSPAPKTLLPGMGGPKLPCIPAAPGSGPPSFFKPTPAASEADSNALGGSNIGSVSGLSGLDPSFPSSRNPSQPNFFIPAAVPSTSSPTTTEDTQGAGAGDETSQGEGVRTSSGSGVVAHPGGSSDGGAGFAMRESDTSGSGRLPAMSGPSNVSFASWQHLRESGTGSPAAAATGAVPQVPEVPAAGEHGLLQASSSADSQPDAQAEVSSTVPGLYHGKQQQPQQSWGSADSNGNGFYMPGPVVGPADNAATEQLANGNHSTGADTQQPQLEEQQPLDSQLSNSWDARPNKDPFDSAAEGLVQAAGWDTTQGYDWEGGGQGGEWGRQQTPVVQYDGYPMEGQQPQDPLATGTAADAGTGWGMQQQPGGWTGQQDGWEGGWGADAAAGAVDAEGVAAAASSTPAAADGDANAWQEQQQPVDGAWQQQQPVDGTWQQQQPVDNTWQQHEQQAADGSWQQQQQQPVQAADGQQAYYGGYGEQYAGATGWEGQQYGASTPAADGSYYQTQEHAQGQDGTGAYSGYYQAAAAAGGEQPAVEVLEPVHPQLPGIAVAGTGSGGVSSPTYAPPGTGGSSGSRGSRAGMRHTSMPGSPLAHQTSMGTLLPQPPRHSAGGLTTQRSMGHDGQAEAAAVVLPTAAAAGDSSLLNTFRPSSPYARAVSPLSRTSTGMGDATAVNKQSSGGFPIPSPPSHGGLLSSRAPSGNMFIPANVAAAATAAVGAMGVPAPWQPGTVAATGSEFMQPQQQQDLGMVNGYDAAAQGHWQQQQQQYETQQQQQQQEQQEQASAYNQQQQLMPLVPSGNSPAAVPPFMPGLLESLPRDAPPSAGRDGTQQQPFMPQGPGSATATAGKRRGPERAHPYDQFLSQALSQVNWRAVHFKQPGKLNKMLPWEEFEMEKALQEEAEKRARGQSRGSPFWYRQMEFRQKLPPDSMRPSASEPAHMPSHAVNRAPPHSAAESAASQVSAYPGWPNSGELQRQQQQQQYQQQYQQLAVPGSPLTPARAATTGAVGAVAAYQQHEEPTPTSRLLTPSEHAPVAEAEAAAAAAGAEQAGIEGEQQQQQWAGWEGYGEQGQQAANGYWQQQYDPRYAEQYGQYTGYEQQQYCDDQQQQYDMSQWQQQQQQEQQQPAEAGVAVEQAGVGPEGWSMEAGAVDRGATWGSPDAEMLEYGATGAQDAEAAAAQQDYCAARQQEYSAAAQQEYPAAAQQDYTAATQLDYSAAQQDYSAAAANGAAGVWGADDAALDLQLGVGVDIAASASAAAAAALAEAAAASAAAPAAGHEWFAPEVIAAARAARISSSSVGLESQPSTGRAAAAAVKRIVSGALDNIMQQYAAVPEEAEQEEAAAAAAAAAAEYGWQGAEAAAAAAAVAGEGWEGAEVLEQAEGMGENAGEEPADGEAAAAATAEDDAGGEVAAAPTSAAWLRLAQQFNTAAEAAAAKGQLQEDFAQYQDLFMQYGQYLLSVLPHDALERAGLLAEEPAAAAASEVPAAAEEEEVEGEEDPDLLAEFGALELKNSAAEGMFASLGFELDTLFECCA